MRSLATPSVQAVLMTAPDLETGERIGTRLVEERLAACANIVPGAVSVFRWDGEVRREGEVLVILKTTEERLDALRERAVELHPYDVPEVLAIPIAGGHAPYLDWVRMEVAG